MAELTLGGAPRGRRRSVRRGRSVAMTTVLLIALVYLLLPLLATVAFSLATVWSRTILPEGYTFRWYREAVSDDRFAPTALRSLRVILASSIISPLIVTPAVLYVHLRAPRAKPYLEFLSIVPWALPGVVLALAMIRAYISPYNVDRPTLLVLTYVLLSLPFMFRAIDAALSSINARTLVEAANVLGAGGDAAAADPEHHDGHPERVAPGRGAGRGRVRAGLADGRLRLEDLPDLPGADAGDRRPDRQRACGAGPALHLRHLNDAHHSLYPRARAGLGRHGDGEQVTIVSVVVVAIQSLPLRRATGGRLREARWARG